MRFTAKFVGVALLISLANASLGYLAVFAGAPGLHQLILPLNCQYEIINDGHGTIRYLTPKECGQVLPPPVNDNPQTHSPETSVGPSSETKRTYPQPSPVLLPPTLDNESRKKLYDTFWQPVLSSTETPTKTAVKTAPEEAQGAAVTLAAVSGGFIILVVLVIFVI